MRTVINAYAHPRPSTDDAALSQRINDLDTERRARRGAMRPCRSWRSRYEMNRRHWEQEDPQSEDEWVHVSGEVDGESVPEEENAAPAKGRVTIAVGEEKEHERMSGREGLEHDPFIDDYELSSAKCFPTSSSSKSSSSSSQSSDSDNATSTSIGRALESTTNYSNPFADTTNEYVLSSYDSRSSTSSFKELSLRSDWTEDQDDMRTGYGQGHAGLQARRDSREITRSRWGRELTG